MTPKAVSFRTTTWSRPDRRRPPTAATGFTSIRSAYRLPSENTLIGGGNNNRVLEVNPPRKIAWSIGREELPGIKLYWVTQLQALPNGNIIVTNTHTGPEYPQIFEMTRKKESFGNSRIATPSATGCAQFRCWTLEE